MKGHDIGAFQETKFAENERLFLNDPSWVVFYNSSPTRIPKRNSNKPHTKPNSKPKICAGTAIVVTKSFLDQYHVVHVVLENGYAHYIELTPKENHNTYPFRVVNFYGKTGAGAAKARRRQLERVANISKIRSVHHR